MGLLNGLARYGKRVGGHFADQFGGQVEAKPYLSRLGDEMIINTTRPGLSVGEMAVAPVSASAMGAGAGALFGAAGTGFGADGKEDMGTAAGRGALQGAGMAGGAAAAMISPMMLKRLVVALWQATKKDAPHLADEEALRIAKMRADSVLKGPDARNALERILGPMDWEGK